MASKYKVLTYGNPGLREKAKRIGTVDEKIRSLAADMLAVMYESKGLGLAAQQIGRTEAICVIDIPPQKANGKITEKRQPGEVKMPIVLINPEIVEKEGAEAGEEGCLSFPEVYVTIKRAAKVKVSFVDLDNRPQVVEGIGLLARALQHEMDHLDGVLLVDRMSPLQKLKVSGKLRQLHRQAKPK